MTQACKFVLVLSKKTFVNVLIWLFVCVCVFIPSDPYNIKLICFVLIIALSIKIFVKTYKANQYSQIYLMGIIFPLLIMITSIITTNDIYASISGSYAAFLILLLIPIKEFNIDYKKIFISMLKIEAYIIVGIAIADIIGFFNVNDNSFIRNIIYDWGIGVMGKSVAYASYYKIFFKTSPLIVFLLDDSWTNKNKILVLISILALIFSGTRANILIVTIYVIWRLEFSTFVNKKHQIILGTFLGGGILCLLPYLITSFFNMMNVAGSVSSDVIRTGQFQGLQESLLDPLTLLIGSGFGSTFYSYGRDIMTADAELAYINLLRQIGLCFFIPFIIFVFKPIMSKLKISIKVIYIGYLAIAFTNPLLYSSTAYLGYIYIYSQMYDNYSYNHYKISKGIKNER